MKSKFSTYKNTNIRNKKSSIFSSMSSSSNPHLLNLGFHQILDRASSHRPSINFPAIRSRVPIKHGGLDFDRQRCLLTAATIDENFALMNTLMEESVTYGISDGEEEVDAGIIYSTTDIDLPINKGRSEVKEPSLEWRTQKFQAFGGPRKMRIRPGIMINMALISCLVPFLLVFDWYSWRIVRLQLKPFHSTQPFLISAVLSACAGWLYIPIVDSMKIHQILRKEGPTTHYIKKGTPTMGGLFFIPIGIAVALGIASQSSLQLYGATIATLAFAAIGLLDDLLSCIKGHNYGLSGWTKLSLQVAVGIWFSFWLDSANISTPYNMKLLVPLPPPIGLVHLGKPYLFLTAFCFAAMGNGVNLTDGLDGLAGGVAAWAFIGMSVAVLAICPDLAIFGASMAGACVGFLFHNRYKASIFMGDTGSLALGGALAAMASCTGMFFPLFISSGVFVMEVLSVMVQVSFVKATKWFYGEHRRFFRMAPVHHHFELCGFREPIIVASAYFISCLFALCAGYIGLISA